MTAAHAVRTFSLTCLLALSLSVAGWIRPAEAQVTAFMQAVAEGAAADRDIAEFYRSTGYAALWTGTDRTSAKRREALLRAIEEAPAHGLPAAAYDTAAVKVGLRSVRSERDLGRLEVAMSKLFLTHARDVQTGVLTPAKVDAGIVREVPYRDRKGLLSAFSKSSPTGFMRALPPQNPEYVRLMKAKVEFERLVARGGWGPEVAASKLEPGQSGQAVVALRNRLIAMGYLKRTATTTYDERMRQAVGAFQAEHGLDVDGVVGPGTLAEINTGATTRLHQIIVAMERERWTNMPRGKRHILVNIPDFHAQVIDDGKVTFKTRAVVGSDVIDQRTPEFSDMMEHMVINPTWNVPRSIAIKEYLPLLQRNPYAAGHLRIIDRRGRTVPRDVVDFRQFNERTFPFDLKQPPSDGNALGLVKFMFPNRYNIYLHDTPTKNLFGRESRAFSHGCIRLGDPFDFAYTLLMPQTSDPVGLFQSQLATGRETIVELEEYIPVHLIYRTAIAPARGRIQFRRDIYGRDARIWQALQSAGVSSGEVQG